MDREETEREAEQRLVEYLEALRKYEELGSQFVAVGWVESDKPIEQPKRVLDIAGIDELDEAQQELDKALIKWNEALERLRESK